MAEPTPHGPFETYEQAQEAAQPLRDAVAAVNASDRLVEQIRLRRAAARVRYVECVLAQCGLELGALDERVVRWLASVAGQEELAIITDWILRSKGVQQ